MNNEEKRFQAAVAAMKQLLIPENLSGVLTGANATNMPVNKALAATCVDVADALLAELDRTKPEPETPQPDADGWIPHRPGDPMPCHEETMCRRKYRSGKIGARDKAGNYSWAEWGGGGHEIIAWKPA